MGEESIKQKNKTERYTHSLDYMRDTALMDNDPMACARGTHPCSERSPLMNTIAERI